MCAHYLYATCVAIVHVLIFGFWGRVMGQSAGMSAANTVVELGGRTILLDKPLVV